MTANKLAYQMLDILLIVSVCFVLYFFDLGHAPFFDKQEPREALVVWEINHSGHWILPLRNGNQIPSKPPLFHWLAALVSRFANQLNEFTIRFPSAFLGTAGVLLIYAAGASLWGRSAGLISATVLATSFEWRQAAKAARVDMTLTFAMLCAFLYFAYLYRSGGDRKKSFTLGILLGLAALAKGPLGVIVPCFAYLLFLWLRRDLVFIKKLYPLIVFGACVLVAGSWYALALQQGGRDFLSIVIKENFSTVVGAEAGHPHLFFWYIPFFYQNAAPWSLFIIPMAIWAYRARRQLDRDGLLYFVVWFLTVLVFFSAFRQKRSVYILPLYPAFALLLGAWSRSLSDGAYSFLAKPAAYLNAVVFLLFSGTLFLHSANPGLTNLVSSELYPKDRVDFLIVGDLLAEHRPSVFLWAALCGVGGLLLFVFSRKGAWKSYFACAVAFMVVSLAFVQRFDNDLAQRYSFKNFMEHVSAIVKDDALYFYRSSDFGVTFYANRRIPLYTNSFQGKHSLFYLLCWEDDWKQLRNTSGLSLEYASDGKDRQIPQRGHLYLIAVNAQEKLKNISEPNT
jgi:4-amino-4-deoxy-L-arabinose transferase-like glycosyltransferase